MKRFSICLFVLVLASAGFASTGCGDGGVARENQILIDTFFSGSGTDSLIDVNGDGTNVLIVWANGKVDGLGNINFSEIIETSMIEPEVPCATSEGIPGVVYELVQGRIALQADRTGDIITGSFISNDQCVPLDSGEDDSVEFEGQWIVTGGTGRFSDASGTVNFSGSARLLLSHVSGRFIIATAHHTGVVNLE